MENNERLIRELMQLRRLAKADVERLSLKLSADCLRSDDPFAVELMSIMDRWGIGTPEAEAVDVKEGS